MTRPSTKPVTTSAFTPPGARSCTKPGCHGALEPGVDRNGASIMECEKCGSIYRSNTLGSLPATSNGTVGGKPCPVKKCPGRVDAGGTCACCAKREAFLEQHLPKRHCQICGGQVMGSKKFCGACAPINTKVLAAKKKAAA